MNKCAVAIVCLLASAGLSSAQAKEPVSGRAVERSIRVLSSLSDKERVSSGIVIEPNWVLVTSPAAFNFRTADGISMKPVWQVRGTIQIVLLYAQGVGKGLPLLSVSNSPLTVGEIVQCVSNGQAELERTPDTGAPAVRSVTVAAIEDPRTSPNQFRVSLDRPQWFGGGAIYGSLNEDKLRGIILGGYVVNGDLIALQARLALLGRIPPRTANAVSDGTVVVVDGAAISRVLQLTQPFRVARNRMKVVHQ